MAVDYEKTRSRTLRQNLSPVEALVWSRLKGRQLGGYKFRRQYPAGGYFIDFYCAERKLGLEFDGSQHAEKDAPAYDAERDRLIAALGIRIVRYWNREVLTNLDGVMDDLLRRLNGADPAK